MDRIIEEAIEDFVEETGGYFTIECLEGETSIGLPIGTRVTYDKDNRPVRLEWDVENSVGGYKTYMSTNFH